MPLIPPELFSLVAVNAVGDPDLPDGLHVRIIPSPELGPPLGPVAVWRSLIPGSSPIHIATAGGSVPTPVVNPPLERFVGAQASTGPITAFDNSDGVIGQRTQFPAVIAAPLVTKIGLSQPGDVQLFATGANLASTVLQNQPETLIAMPITSTPWYAGGTSTDIAMKRVAAGAPRHLTVLDRPQGPFLPPGDENTRVAGAVKLVQCSALTAALFTNDRPEIPAIRIFTQTSATQTGAGLPAKVDVPASVDLPIWGTLLMQAMDYGIARYLGLGAVLSAGSSDVFNPLKATGSRGQTNAVWALAIFGIPKHSFEVDDPTTPPDTPETALVDWPTDLEESAWIKRMTDLIPDLNNSIAKAKAAGLQIRAALTCALTPPPPDTCGVPAPDIAKSSWISEDDKASTAWRQTFAFGLLPSTVAGMAMASGNPLLPRNPVDPDTKRFQLMLIGRNAAGVPLIFDRVTAPVQYQFAVADLFGRFGPQLPVTVDAPPRPKPPKPVPQILTQRGTVPGGLDPASPGTATLTVPIPQITTLAAGALPITRLTVTFNTDITGLSIVGDDANPITTKVDVVFNSNKPTPVTIKDFVTVTFPLPKLAPMASGTWPLTVQFFDSGNQQSPLAKLTVSMADARAPQPIPAAAGLIWTSRAANATETEVTLSWSGNVAAHIYEASAASLIAELQKLDPNSKVEPTKLSRAELAAKLAPGNNTPAYSRVAFARLTSDPVQPDADGKTRFTATLPRSQRTVSFLKIVSVSPLGVESDFAKAGIISVAVPDDLPPPPPLLTAIVGPDGTSVTLTIQATGLDRTRLFVAEPSLLTPNPTSKDKPRNPEYRLRRATGPITDPLYARSLGNPQPLTVFPKDDPKATFTDSSLKPFIRATWWAEVRMPADRVLPPGASAASPSSNAATTLFDWQRQDMAAPFSRLSAPVSLIPAPTGPPAALVPSQVKTQILTKPNLNGAGLSVVVTSLPVATAGAIAPFRLTIRLSRGSGPLERAAPDVDITDSTFSWNAPITQPSPARLSLTVTDPLGRESLPFMISF